MSKTYVPTKVNSSRGEKLQQPVNLVDITTTHNPRCPAPGLVEAIAAEEDLADLSLIQVVHRLALSDNVADKNRFIQLVEKNDEEENGLVDLASSRRHYSIQAPLLRRFRGKNHEESKKQGSNVYDTRYGVVSGERRILAAAYNHCKHGDPAQIICVVAEFTLDQAQQLAFDENVRRKDMTDLEIGSWIRERFEQKRQVVKEETNKSFSFKDFCTQNDLDYQYAQSRRDLTYLPENLQQKVKKGKLGITEGASVGKDIRNGKLNKDGSSKETGEVNVQDKKNKRRRTKSYSEVETHFDENRGKSKGYLQALAFCLGLEFDEAIAESDARLVEIANQVEAEAA